jgi:hypothetical protein
MIFSRRQRLHSLFFPQKFLCTTYLQSLEILASKILEVKCFLLVAAKPRCVLCGSLLILFQG